METKPFRFNQKMAVKLSLTEFNQFKSWCALRGLKMGSALGDIVLDLLANENKYNEIVTQHRLVTADSPAGEVDNDQPQDGVGGNSDS